MVKPRSHFQEAGFNLVELMVAIAVLAIILVAAAKILSTTAALTTANNKHMDANDQARMVFDRMADDFARMVKRKDVDYIFWKNTPVATPTTGVNDAMYFYTEGASYFDASTFSNPAGATNNSEKNSVSLVGYRINNNAGTFPATASTDPSYYQLERLGKALSWDGGAYNAAQSANNSIQPNVMAFLTYPPAGVDVPGVDPTNISYSTAYFLSTLAGAYSNNSSGNYGNYQASSPVTSAVGSIPGSGVTAIFNDSTDNSYRTVGSQVFRFEYCFQLKDGTFSDKPMMLASATNGIPSSTSVTSGTQRPLPTNDSTTSLATAGTGGSKTVAAGSRWWDKTNHIGYICLDATPSNAVWHEIGIQDVAAIIVTIAVIDKQGLVFVNAKGGDLSKVAAKLLDYSPTVVWPTGAATGNPAYLLDASKSTAPVSWAYALLPGQSVSTATIIGSTKIPQAMISQIRLYQRYFYLNNF